MKASLLAVMMLFSGTTNESFVPYHETVQVYTGVDSSEPDLTVTFLEPNAFSM